MAGAGDRRSRGATSLGIGIRRVGRASLGIGIRRVGRMGGMMKKTRDGKTSLRKPGRSSTSKNPGTSPAATVGFP